VHFVNISATLDAVHAPFQIHASSAKVAVDAMTRSWASEWGQFGIRAVALAPGYVEGTEGFDRLGGFAMGKKGLPDKAQWANDAVPIGYFATVEDISYVVVFLATNAGRYISGTTIVVDGGNAVFRKPLFDPQQLEVITSKLKGAPVKSKL